jgi:hypothetical protein
MQHSTRRRCLSAAKTRILPALCVLLCLLIAHTFAQPKLQDTAQSLFASLTEEQKKQALLPFDSPERNSEVFPGGERAGIQIKTLNAEQQKLAQELLTQFTSAAGRKTVHAIADQPSNTADHTTGFGRYYLCFFGDPTADKNYAWRIAEHHMTIVHVEIADGQPRSFGPILLGANPPDLFDAEEDKMIALYNATTDEERAKCANPGRAISSARPRPNTKSLRVADLNPTARQAAADVHASRLTFFADDIRSRIRAMTSDTRVDDMQIAFFGEATKKCREGGRWDFKLFADNFLCDYEGSRAHIHMSLKCSVGKQ